MTDSIEQDEEQGGWSWVVVDSDLDAEDPDDGDEGYPRAVEDAEDDPELRLVTASPTASLSPPLGGQTRLEADAVRPVGESSDAVVNLRSAGGAWLACDPHQWARWRARGERLGWMAKTIAEAVEFIDAYGYPMTRVQVLRAKAFLSGEIRLGDNGASRPVEEEDLDDWLQPGLLPWGCVPLLGGAPKVGKTSVAIDFATAMANENYDFLGRFPGSLVNSETTTTWLINAETPTHLFGAEVRARAMDAGSADGTPSEFLVVKHLQEVGGPTSFDVTDPAKYDYWALRLWACEECDGADDGSLGMVIVDGLTSILGGDTSRVGEWYAKFRDLLREVGCPNGLVTVHNTLREDHPMGGVEAAAGADGVWTYGRQSNEPGARRYFGVASPRLGGVPVPWHWVDLDPQGRLLLGDLKGKRGGRSKGADSDSGTAAHTSPMGASAASEAGGGRVDAEAAARRMAAHSTPTQTPQAKEDLRDRVLEYVSICNAHGTGPSGRQIRSEVGGLARVVDQAVADLVDADRLEQRARAGRGGGWAYWTT